MKSFLNYSYISRIVSLYKNREYYYKDFIKFFDKPNTKVLNSNKSINKNKPKIEYK